MQTGRSLELIGTASLSWWDLKCFLKHPARDSAFVRLRSPEHIEWTLTNHLLATAVDALHGGNWQRGGGKAANKPKPIPRPGVESHTVKRHRPKRTYTTAEIDQRLGLKLGR